MTESKPSDRRGELVAAMQEIFGADRRRVRHAITVLGHAEAVHAREGGDEDTVIAAAILHDVGIPAAEAKHGSSAGRHQEVEGPPIAREILRRLGFDEARTDHVCRIIANHHTGKGIDTTEFRILWDADWLVNLPDVYPDATREELARHIERLFRTATGRRLAEEMYLHTTGA